MSINATSGVVSNIDYQALITQLVGLRRQPIEALSAQKKTLETTNSAYGGLSSKVKDLISAADALRTPTSFKAFTASVSDTSIFTAQAGASSAYGSYEIKVNTIAKSHKIAADGVAADTAAIAAGAGSFSFQAGAGAIQTVAVDATTTLAGLKDSINALKAGVTATIVNDGAAGNPYRLILTSDKTGTSNGLTITQNDTTLNFATTLQAAQDTTLTVDGMSYVRQTNSISDIVSGVALDLKSADPAKTVTLTVGRDTAAIEEKAKKLVDAYNGVVSYIKGNNRYDSTIKRGGPFFGDTVARSVLEDLRRVITSAASGLPDTMNRLMHAGISTDKDGVLSLDSAKFQSALSADFDAVVNLFAEGAATNGFGSLVHTAASDIDDFVDGRIKGRQDGIKKNISRIELSIREKEAQLLTYEDQLRSQFTGLETMLASLKNQSNALSGF